MSVQEPRKTVIPLGLKAAAAICGAVAENTLHFPLSIPWMMVVTHGTRLLDMVPARSAGTTYRMLDEMGQAGRHYYLMLIWTVDLILPFLFSAFLTDAIDRAASMAFGSFSRVRRLSWLGLLAGGSDYAENLTETSLLMAYPAQHSVLAVIAAGLTSIKFTAYGVSLLVAMLLAMKGWIRARQATTSP